MSATRRPLIGGNWKMNFLRRDAEAYCRTLAPAIAATAAEVVLFPPFPWIDTVVLGVRDTPIACGGQDIHPEASGAYTGDVSGAMLRDAGCSWTLCGHSERRRDHHEDDALVARKASAAAAVGLTPMICIGESLDERKAGRAFEVLARQLDGALAGRPEPSAIAYEPIWAIGTGETATPETAQEAHRHIREVLADLLGDDAAGAKRIVYGGSVKPGNAVELFAQPDIDGFLVGGASLDAAGFSAIIGVCG